MRKKEVHELVIIGDVRPKTPCIYKIVHKESGKEYIGQTRDIIERRRHHQSRLKRGIHHCTPLQASWNKYGQDAFYLEVIEYVPVDELTSYEDYYWSLVSPKMRFNVERPGEKHTYSSVRVKEKRNRAIIGTNLTTKEEREYPYISKVIEDGFKRPLVTRVLSGEISQTGGWAWIYKDGLPHQQMSVDRRQGLLRRQGRPVIGTNPVTGERREYPSIKEAAEAFNLAPPTISYALSGKLKTAAGWTWVYKNETDPV